MSAHPTALFKVNYGGLFMLDNTFYKLTHDKKLTIGYFGGSITEGAGASNQSKTSWRALTTEFFRSRYHDAEVIEIQASIGGTGSDLGMYRCDDDLTSKNPDLVFVEFAVNDCDMSYASILSQVETIYRKILRANPFADIVCVITTTKTIATVLERGGEFVARTAHAAVAHHYGAPILDFGNLLHFAVLRNGGDFLTLTADTVHPNDDGYALYASCAKSFVLECEKNAVLDYIPHKIPSPLCGKLYENARMIPAHLADDFETDGFTLINGSMCGRYPSYIEATAPGSTFSFTFVGENCGFYLMLAKDSGDAKVSVDGGDELFVRSWDLYCPAFNRAGAAFFAKNLPYGRHRVTVRLSETKAEESTGTALRIGAILVS